LFIPTNANIIQSIKSTLKFDNEFMFGNIMVYMIPYWDDLQQILSVFDCMNFCLIGIYFKDLKKISIFAIGNGSGNLTCGDTGTRHVCTLNVSKDRKPVL
jgi:hypothetical protein